MTLLDQLILDVKYGFRDLAADVKGILPRVLPAGGSVGQVLTKTSGADYATSWVNPASTVDWRAGLSELTITTNSTQAIQNAIDGAGPSGRKIIFPATLGTYAPTDQLYFSGKQNVILTGLDNPTWQTNQGNYSFVAFLGNNKNIDLTGLKLVNTMVSAQAPNVALVHGYEQGPNLNLRLANLELTSPQVFQNAITFTPYSPLGENGNGIGNPLNDLIMEGCWIHDVPRCAIEVNCHMYVDGRYESFFNGVIIRRNRFERIGGGSANNSIPVVTFGGISTGGQIYDNVLIDGTYAGIELVSAQDYTCWSNYFFTTPGWTQRWSGYAITNNPGRPCKNIQISGGGGYVNARAFILHNIEGLKIFDVDFVSQFLSDVQSVTNGSLNRVNLKVLSEYTGVAGEFGGSVLEIHNSSNLSILAGRYELAGQNAGNCYSVIGLPAGGNNKNISIVGATLKRPAGSNDSFIHVEGNTQGLIDSQNTKIN